MSTDRRPDEPAVEAVVDRAWRAASQDEPPAGIDAAIIAAARIGVRGPSRPQQSAGRRARWTGWRPLAAAASVVGLAFVLVQSITRGPAPVPPQESAATTASMRESARESAPVPTPEKPAPVTGRQTAPTVAAADADQPASPPTLSAEATALSAAAQRGAQESAAAAPAREPAAPTPEAWVQRIVELHAAGDADAATAALLAFRAAYPDADEHLPPVLRTWAAAVPAEGDR
jgi:cytoskeletal protein RodZ